MSVSQIAAAMVYPSVLLIANQGMVFRDRSLIKTGVNRKEGLMVLAGVGAISLLLWGVAVRVKENLPKGEGRDMSLKKLEVHHVTKRIHGNVVLQDISRTFLAGKIYGLKGINGSGKTMLMRLLCGLIRPSEGEIFYDEKKLGIDFRFPPSVGILLENPSFLDSCTGLQNLKMIADINQKITEKEMKDTLFRVGLDPEDQRKYRKYSLGMKQRLGVAAAVMERPDLLILDEPFNALDTSGIEMVSHLLEEEKKNGALVIFSCHDNEILKTHSDQILELSEGRIVGKSDEKKKILIMGAILLSLLWGLRVWKVNKSYPDIPQKTYKAGEWVNLSGSQMEENDNRDGYYLRIDEKNILSTDEYLNLYAEVSGKNGI